MFVSIYMYLLGQLKAKFNWKVAVSTWFVFYVRCLDPPVRGWESLKNEPLFNLRSEKLDYV